MTTRTIDMSHPRGLIAELGDNRATIRAQAMVHQPKDWPELEAWLDRLSGSERAVATTAALMAWNLAARYDGHNEALEAQNEGGAQ